MYSTVHTRVVRKSRNTEKQLTKQAAIKRVQEFVHAVQLRGIPLSHAVLFGSYARNEQHDYSDIDLALVSDSFQGLAILDVEPFRDLKIKPNYVMFEVHTFNTSEFENGSNPFVNQEIKKKGIVIL